MCGPPPKESGRCQGNGTVENDFVGPLPNDRGSYRVCLAVAVAVVVVAVGISLVPSWVYLNRGYTVWYHYLTLTYLLLRILLTRVTTQSQQSQQSQSQQPWFLLAVAVGWLRRFVIVQGTGISLGWYAALWNDWYRHGRCGDILYRNASVLSPYLIEAGTGRVKDDVTAVVVRGLVHLLDLCLHPGIVVGLVRSHVAERSNPPLPTDKLHPDKIPDKHHPNNIGDDLCTWSLIGCAFGLSRIWSMVHTYHNHDGAVRGWYFGHDVYHLHDLDGWMPAYVTEGLFLALMALYRCTYRYRHRCPCPT